MREWLSSSGHLSFTAAVYHAGMDGIAWAASAMSAAQTRLEIAAQNLANGSTDGFRRSVARGWLDARGVRVEGIADSGQGALRRTGRALDRAIVGGGSFVLRGADGRTVRTRSGAFTRDRFGTLRDDLGRALARTSLAPGSYVRRPPICDVTSGRNLRLRLLGSSNARRYDRRTNAGRGLKRQLLRRPIKTRAARRPALRSR
jgi:hypothetical protein